MDDHWETEVIEYGAINITGFRLLDMNQLEVKHFLSEWKNLDSKESPGAGRNTISVRIMFVILRKKYIKIITK